MSLITGNDPPQEVGAWLGDAGIQALRATPALAALGEGARSRGLGAD